MTLFELVASLVLDTTDFDRDVKNATDTGEGLAQSLEGVTAKAVAMGNAMYDMASRAASAAWNFAGDLIQTSADVQAENAQFASVFAENADQANSIFGRLSDVNSIYISRLRQSGTSFFSQFKAGGMAASEALSGMEQALALTADAAAFYDISLEDAAYRLRSFLRGNVEAGEAIGLFSNDVIRTEYAARMYEQAWKELNEAQRESVLLQIAKDTYDQMNATGQAAREAENYANVLGNLKAQWRDVKAVLGAPVLTAIVPVIQELQDFLAENPDKVQAFADGIGLIADKLADVFIWLIDFVGTHSEEIFSFIESAAGFLGFVPRKTGPGELADEDYTGPSIEESYTTAETDRNLNTQATDAVEKAQVLADEMMRLATIYNRTGEGEDAFVDAFWALSDLLGEQGTNRLSDWLSETGIDTYEPGEAVPEEGYKLPETLFNELMGLPQSISEAVSAGIQGALSGMSVNIDGSIIAGYVTAAMARDSRGKRYTGAPANA